MTDVPTRMSQSIALNPPLEGTAATSLSRSERVGSVLACGLGMAVAMWTVGYIARFPGIEAANWLLFFLLIATQVVGGIAVGVIAPAGRWRSTALWAGGLTAVVNMLILGSLLSDLYKQVADADTLTRLAAFAWVPVYPLLSAVLVAVAAYIGRQWRGDRAVPAFSWAGAIAVVAVAATVVLITTGGLVTGARAGLAVPDWPNSFGYNMWLYPLSKMTGGIYLEHAHRLKGTLVGLCTVTLAGFLLATDSRRFIKVLAVAAVLLVIAQGTVGGFRVTMANWIEGSLGIAVSTAADETTVSLALAIVHGTLAQVFLAVLVGLAVLSSRTYREATPAIVPSTGFDRVGSAILVVALIVQILLGAKLRHMDAALIEHIVLAMFVLLIGVAVGMQAWAREGVAPTIARWGKTLIALFGIVLTLGLVALIARTIQNADGTPHAADILLTTAHQISAALTVMTAVVLMVLNRRLLKAEPKADEGEPESTPA